MKARKIIAAVLAVALLGCILTACGNNTDENSPVPDVTNSAGGNTDYAIILKTLSNDFWAKMKTGIEEEAKKLGVKVDIFAAQNEEDTAGQLTILENCLAKNYKAIGMLRDISFLGSGRA